MQPLKIQEDNIDSRYSNNGLKQKKQMCSWQMYMCCVTVYCAIVKDNR